MEDSVISGIRYVLELKLSAVSCVGFQSTKNKKTKTGKVVEKLKFQGHLRRFGCAIITITITDATQWCDV